MVRARITKRNHEVTIVYAKDFEELCRQIRETEIAKVEAETIPAEKMRQGRTIPSKN